MKALFGDDLLLNGSCAKEIYSAVKGLPIIDYHCHLDEKQIAQNGGFSDIGEMWLKADHYKWRAMRLCGVDEHYITGDASYKEKFTKYAEILPKLVGNPLYYWTHLELKSIFDIKEPLSADNADRIWSKANEKLKSITVRDLLKKFAVEYIATTDDPVSELSCHGKYGITTVAPTFRPDRAFDPDGYAGALEKAVGRKITSAADYFAALVERLDYFVAHGCKISDHGFERFPTEYATDAEAEDLFSRRNEMNGAEKDKFFGWLLVKLAKEYARRGIIMQMHYAVIRNCSVNMYARCGADSGFDLIGERQNVKYLIKFLDMLGEDERPQIVLYTLNDENLAQLAAVTGAFPGVRMGAAWWFNDTVQGIKRNLSVIGEYSALGTNLGMLSDSRSFSSYIRFDFFRRILSDHLGALADGGECDKAAALRVAKDICYDNIKEALKL